MILSKTPLRISWFGGGVDLPEMNVGNQNLVIGGTINRYIWNFVAENGIGIKRHKVNYANVEEVTIFDEIVHPLYREALKLCSQGSNEPVGQHSCGSILWKWSWRVIGIFSWFAEGPINIL